ncbi:alternative ribosome rescue aminoacyl-tRNA hydrolase ArfB [Chryseolinea sp. T2]|uniref:alternative ribosome rescue aminoacyl-tRNA hydrolase ArfB n=1 Tax=Chryseolinea sp. T2 TaxID=3129255 RepID=UPI003076BFA4
MNEEKRNMNESSKTLRKLDAKFLNSELEFTASRSDGPGGQNVNKVSTKITLRFNVRDSQLLNGDEKDRILKKLATRLTKEGVLILSGQASRSQLQNKLDVEEKLNSLLLTALNVEKTRKKTKPTKSSREKRKFSKMLNSDKKKWRQKP